MSGPIDHDVRGAMLAALLAVASTLLVLAALVVWVVS